MPNNEPFRFEAYVSDPVKDAMISLDAAELKQMALQELANEIMNLFYPHGFCLDLSNEIKNKIESWFNNLKWPVR